MVGSHPFEKYYIVKFHQLYLYKCYTCGNHTIVEQSRKKTHIPVDDVTLTPQLDIETWPKRKMEPHNHLLEKVKTTSNPTIRFEGLKQTNEQTNKQTTNQPNKQTTNQTNKQTNHTFNIYLANPFNHPLPTSLRSQHFPTLGAMRLT